MSIYNVTQHFYRETAGLLKGRTLQSWQRQGKEAQAYIEDSLNRNGPKVTSSLMHAVVEFSKSYTSSRPPEVGEVLAATSEMLNAGIHPGTGQFTAEVQRQQDQNLYSAYVIRDGQAVKIPDSSNVQSRPGQITEQQGGTSELAAALAYQKSALAEATRYGQEDDAARYERNIERIERQIQQQNPAPTHKQPDRDGPNQQAADALERELLDVRSHTEGQRDIHQDSIDDDYDDETYAGWDEDFSQ